ncbi:MAG: hypothetical protein KAT34_15895 [Candidatus Aminicenantes bacterium]|nr:hypothetical protein [Candidatus Aminicenantes bacterium]
MKKRYYLKLICGLFFLYGLLFPLIPQQEDQVIREEVKVTNVEVPVRVFFKGKPMDNLTKPDFKLYEDGKLQEINGFYLNRKKINVPYYDLKAEEEKRKPVIPRYFALVFNLTDYHENLEKGLDYMFDNILKEDDQLLVMMNERIFFYEDLSDKELVHRNIKNLARNIGTGARKEIIDYLRRIERRTDELRHLLQADQDAVERAAARGGDKVNVSQRGRYIERFLTEYVATWSEFKRRYLSPNLDKFYYFSRHLQKIKREKWVINFHQMIKFPQIKRTSDSMQGLIDLLDTNKYHKMNFELKAATDFPTEDVSRLFYKVNATFHSILIPTPKDIVSEDLEYREISTAFENFLRDITKKTGGTLISSANLVSALDTIRDVEDIYYMLTYEPEDPKKIGKIKVVLTDKTAKYKVVYDKNIRSAYIKEYLAKKAAENPVIKIKEMAFANKKLELLIGDFLIKEAGKTRNGKIAVHIVVEDKDGKVLFDKSRQLNPENKPTSLSIDFDWMGKGKYYILADVLDELTGQSGLEFVQAEVAGGKTTLSRVEYADEEEKGEEISIPLYDDKELNTFLLGAAKYCEKLRKGAFHFYCKEKVEAILDLSDLAFRPESESNFWRNVNNRSMSRSERMKAGKRMVRVYVFDYQILSSKGKVTEQRKLISTKADREADQEELKGRITSFLAERAVFGPITLLSREQQDKFNFKLLKYEKKKKRRFAVIEATPRNKKVNFSYGKVWVDTEDFSVRKIKVDPRSISGHQKLLQMARKLQSRLFLSCKIDYNELHNGLCFPTRVLVEETYKGGPLILRIKGYRGWERNKTIFTYTDYQFFDVEVEVTDR